MTNKLMPGADVWFRAGVHELQLRSDQPLAARVTYVHHSGLVNLIVWGKGGESFQRASVAFWGGEGDAPTSGNYASWINEGEFDALDAPSVADVTRHPFEGRPSGGMEDLDRARVAQSELDARGNMDHGAPRSWGQSPNAGGPLAIDDHKPHPFAKDPVAHPGSAPPEKKGAPTPPFVPFVGALSGGEADRSRGFGQLSSYPANEASRAPADSDAAQASKAESDRQAGSWDPKAPPFGAPPNG